ncbi:sigma 54-interacting transcriptional regulator [Bacilliculturomica massiliensis]|uniref:sigma 54-interacting transcriptional regulator n=1 Tax=Bacilliculturomica massiliensis TaxID=1917867 RepID=UPI001030520A|nr:sigma 54-interacting transcriptional regulator [Bacilliculturomica massiliensis]
MKDIVLIAPYKAMVLLANEIIGKEKYENVQVVRGDLQEGVQLAVQAVEEGARVLISRGGTFTEISSAVKAPAVEIKISAYDILDNMKNIIGRDEPVAIIGYNNVIFGYKMIEAVRKNVTQVNLEQGEDPRVRIQECVDKGIRTFVGDAVVERICERSGYPCYLLESGEEVIRNAIEEAQRILMASNLEQERAKRNMAVIDYVHDGVVSTDESNRILVCNSVAEKILGVKKEEIIDRRADEIEVLKPLFPKLREKQTQIDELRQLNNRQTTVSLVPVSVNNEDRGTVAVFQEVASLQSMEKKVRAKLMEKGFVAKYTFDSIIYRSEQVGRCIAMAKKFSRYDSDILIQGQSGVGKELFAQSIHNESRRRTGPFVAINCAALPETIIESELFGYVEGAFTGSRPGGKAGVFELAHGGTIFLDEISELPTTLQGRLLRVIQEREIMRLGDDKIIPLDVRIVCATNRELTEMVREGTFRRDLLYRINPLSFYVPPLNERREDIEVLAFHFLRIFCRRYSKQIEGFSEKAMTYLSSYDYEGNARELKGMIERAVILCDDRTIRLAEISRKGEGAESDAQGRGRKDGDPAGAGPAGGGDLERGETGGDGGENGAVCRSGLSSLEEVESRYILKVYEATGGSTGETCAILKINRSTLWRKLRKYRGAAGAGEQEGSEETEHRSDMLQTGTDQTDVSK